MAESKPCSACNGTGKISKSTTIKLPFFGEKELLRKEDPCPACKGTGKA